MVLEKKRVEEQKNLLIDSFHKISQWGFDGLEPNEQDIWSNAFKKIKFFRD